MAFIPVPQCLRVVMEYNLNGVLAVNTLHYRQSGAWNPSNATTQCNLVRDWWIAHLKNLTYVGCALLAVRGYDLSSQTGFVVSATNLPVLGAALIESVPNNVAPSIRFYASGRGRNNRGRMYLPGIDKGYMDTPRTFNTSFVNALVTAVGQLAGYVVQGATQVIVSRYLNGQPRLQGEMADVVTRVVSNGIDSQRRRLGGGE